MPAASTFKEAADFTSCEATYPTVGSEDRSRSGSKNSESDHSSNEDSGVSLPDTDREAMEELQSEIEIRSRRCDENKVDHFR